MIKENNIIDKDSTSLSSEFAFPIFPPILNTTEKLDERIDSILDIIINGASSLIIKVFPFLKTKINEILSIPEERKKLIKLMRDFGGSSAETSAALIHVMLKNTDPETLEELREPLSVLLTHHLFEVIGDSLDPGKQKDTKKMALVSTLGALSVQVVKEGTGVPVGITDMINQKVEEELNKKVSLKANNILRQIGLDLSNIEVTLGHLLALNLEGTENIVIYIKQLGRENPQLKPLVDFLLESLAGRYTAVITNLNPETNYEQMKDLNQAIKVREDAILIKVTMTMIILGLLKNDNRLNKFFAENEYDLKILLDNIISAVSIGASLIGLYNDLGSHLLNLPPNDAVKLVRSLRDKFSHPDALPREFLAPEWYQESLRIMKASTSELTNIRATGNEAEKIEWNKVVQLLKDAPCERNLFLDFGGVKASPEEEWTYRENLLIALNVYVSETKIKLRDVLLKLPKVIRGLISNTVEFHEELYTGGDYYGEKRSGLNLPIVVS